MFSWLSSLFGKHSGLEKVYAQAKDIYPDLERLVRDTRTEFLAVGTAFDRSPKHLRDAIEEQLAAGKKFTYVHLSKNADLSLFAEQFGQTVEMLKSEIDGTYAVFAAMKGRHPHLFSHFPTKRCPHYRMYVADPHSAAPRGIIVFYGSATDSPQLPAYLVRNFNLAPWKAYLTDFIRYVDRKRNNKVFIIHGHGLGQRLLLERMLQRMGLEPVAMIDHPGGSRTFIEKFLDCARDCAYAVAVFTPDDVVEVATGGETKRYFQPRPNAIFEVGWFAGTLGRERVLVVCQKGIQMFSDFHGVETLEFATDIEEVYVKLERELRAQEILPA
jgi:hypothetical protein